MTAQQLLCGMTLLLFSLSPAAQPSDEFTRLIFEPVLLSEAQAGGSGNATTATSSSTDADAAASAGEQGTIREYDAAIDQTLETEGLYSETLREQYQALGLLQQRLGQHESAVSTFEKAVHIARVNKGLFTPDQIEDVERMVESLVALGDKERETEYRAYLYYVQQKAWAPDDPRQLAAMAAWADWNLQTFAQSTSVNPRLIMMPGGNTMDDLVVISDDRSGEVRFVPRRFLSSQTSAGGFDPFMESARFAISPELVVDDRLRTARDTYNAMLETGTSSLDADEQKAIRMKVIDAELALKRQMENLLARNTYSLQPASNSDFSRRELMMVNRGYIKSLAALQEIVAAQSPASQALAKAYLDLADFHLAFSEANRANDAYRLAQDTLIAAGIDAAGINQFFNPEPLIPVPAFATHWYSRNLFGIAAEEQLEYLGYIDVELDINRYGDVRGFNVLQLSEGTPYELRNKLRDYLETQKVRPQWSNGELTGIDDLTLRFYYTY